MWSLGKGLSKGEIEQEPVNPFRTVTCDKAPDLCNLRTLDLYGFVGWLRNRDTRQPVHLPTFHPVSALPRLLFQTKKHWPFHRLTVYFLNSGNHWQGENCMLVSGTCPIEGTGGGGRMCRRASLTYVANETDDRSKWHMCNAVLLMMGSEVERKTYTERALTQSTEPHKQHTTIDYYLYIIYMIIIDSHTSSVYRNRS